jgi:hypothetical protein
VALVVSAAPTLTLSGTFPREVTGSAISLDKSFEMSSPCLIKEILFAMHHPVTRGRGMKKNKETKGERLKQAFLI